MGKGDQRRISETGSAANKVALLCTSVIVAKYAAFGTIAYGTTLLGLYPFLNSLGVSLLLVLEPVLVALRNVWNVAAQSCTLFTNHASLLFVFLSALFSLSSM